MLQRGLAVQISRRGWAVADLRSVAGGVVGENFSGDTQTGQGRERRRAPGERDAETVAHGSGLVIFTPESDRCSPNLFSFGVQACVP